MLETQVRRMVELVLRITAVVVLLVALVWSWRESTTALTVPIATISRASLSDTTGLAAVREIARHVSRENGAMPTSWPRLFADVGSLPALATRRVVSAAIAAGIPFSWHDGTNARGLALSAEAMLDPNGGVLLRSWVGAQTLLRADSALVLRDAVGLLDSAVTDVLTVRASRIAGRPLASRGASYASVDRPATPTLRHILLVARVGWEAKFVIAALEERGWNVDGSLQLSPRTSVTIGTPSRLDTARFATVIVLDSGVANLSTLARYVKQGGGLVLAGDALRDAALTSLLTASVGAQRTAVPGALLTNAPRDGLPFWRLTPRARTVVLQYDGSGVLRTPAVVVQRRGAGRVLVSGYRDTWRWRMQGTDDGINAHRGWWSALVSAVAFAPHSTYDTIASAWPADAAPYADLVARWGVPTAMPRDAPSTEQSTSRRWILYVVALIALLGEWGSRRLRGAP